MGNFADALEKKIKSRQANVAVVGLGYVGLPLALVLARREFQTVGFDVDAGKVERLKAGGSYIHTIPAASIQEVQKGGHFTATADAAVLGEADAIIICVPTPLTRQREPDLRYVTATAELIARHLRPGQLIILESTTYPGTTSSVLRPILEQGGLKSGEHFFLAFSPEREDPGNVDYSTARIPKVVGGDGADAMRLAKGLYDQIVTATVPVSSTETAEAVKLTENIFRAVNIALVNELKVIYDAMGIDVWEVIEAAKTKPFGFMPFYPGPGLGGHCIPIDPFYLTWKAREYDISTRFIELAGEINTAMPLYVRARLAETLDLRQGKGLNGSRILILGIAYKKNVDDMRESPSLKLMELIEERGAKVDYYDPLIPVIPPTREHAGLANRASIAWKAEAIAGYDAVLIATDHDSVDYETLVESARLVIDTRNVCARKGVASPKIVKS